MRIPALATCAIVAIGAISAAVPAQAQSYGRDYPVCLKVYGPLTYNDCSYISVAQCNASASGRAAQCIANPFFANAPEPGVRHRRYRNY